MGLYKYFKKLRKSEEFRNLYKTRLMELRKQKESIIRVDRPTNLIRARSLGYKAKQGYVIARIKLKRGGRQRPKIRKGRRSVHFGRKKIISKSYQWVAEERTAKKYPNLSVLNSYQIAQDGNYFWFEIILVDPEHPVIKSDKNINWITGKKHLSRVFHGKTSAGKRSRGLQ